MKTCTLNNPVNATLKVIGGKWKPLIVWYLDQEPMRFGQLKKAISGITQKMLTQQLRELEIDDIVSRKVFPEIPPKVVYSLTEHGRSLKPLMDAMANWGEKHTNLKSEIKSKQKEI